MSPLLRSMLAHSVAWPLLSTLALLALVALARRAALPDRAAPALRAAALVAGFLLALRLIHGPIALPPADAVSWLVWLVPAAFVVFALDDLAGFPGWLRWAAQAAFVVLACWLIFGALLQRDLAGNAASVGVGLVLWLAAWGYLDRLPQGRFAALALTLVAAGNAIATAATGSVLLGQLSGALAAALGAWLLWRGWRADARLGHAGVAVGTVALGSLMLVGRVYAGTPVVLGLLLVGAIALDAALLAALSARRGPAAAARLALQTGALILPVALAVALTLWIYLPRTGEY